MNDAARDLPKTNELHDLNDETNSKQNHQQKTIESMPTTDDQQHLLTELFHTEKRKQQTLLLLG